MSAEERANQQGDDVVRPVRIRIGRSGDANRPDPTATGGDSPLSSYASNRETVLHNVNANIIEETHVITNTGSQNLHFTEEHWSSEIKSYATHQPPKFVQVIKAYRVLSTDTLTLVCEVASSPPAMFDWFVNDRPANQDRKRFRVRHGLNISTLTVEGPEQGVYSCSACNPAGTSKTYGYVIVNETKTLKNIERKVVNEEFLSTEMREKVGQPPKFRNQVPNLTLKPGTDAVIDVEVDSTLDVSFTWYVDGKAIVEGQSADAEMFYPDVNRCVALFKLPKSGKYTVVAQNQYGAAKSTGFIEIEKDLQFTQLHLLSSHQGRAAIPAPPGTSQRAKSTTKTTTKTINYTTRASSLPRTDAGYTRREYQSPVRSFEDDQPVYAHMTETTQTFTTFKRAFSPAAPLPPPTKKFLPAAPHFVNELPEEITLNPNERLVLTVDVAAKPQADIRWNVNGFELQSSKQCTVLNEQNRSTIVIQPPVRQGRYNVTAENDAGTCQTMTVVRHVFEEILPTTVETRSLPEFTENITTVVTSSQYDDIDSDSKDSVETVRYNDSVQDSDRERRGVSTISQHSETITTTRNVVYRIPRASDGFPHRPMVTVKPEDEVRLEAGQPLVLETKVESIPPSTIKWYQNNFEVKNSQNVIIEELESNHSRCTFLAPVEGSYRSVATNEHGSVTTTTRVTTDYTEEVLEEQTLFGRKQLQKESVPVYKPVKKTRFVTKDTLPKIPVIITRFESNLKATENQPMTLEVEADAIPEAEFSWRVNNFEVKQNQYVKIDNSVSNKSSATFLRPVEGRYEVVAKNRLGQDSCTGRVAIDYLDQAVPPKMGRPPFFIEALPVRTVITEKENKNTLVVVVQTDTTGTFNWFADGEVLENNSEHQIINEFNKSTLIIRKRLEKAVEYAVQYTNVYGIVHSKTTVVSKTEQESRKVEESLVEESAFEIRSKAPRFVELLSAANLTEGEELNSRVSVAKDTVECTFKWYINGSSIPESFIQSTGYDSTLKIPLVTKEMSGMLLVVAENRFGVAESSMFFTVEQRMFGLPPRSVKHFEDTMIAEEKTTTTRKVQRYEDTLTVDGESSVNVQKEAQPYTAIRDQVDKTVTLNNTEEDFTETTNIQKREESYSLLVKVAEGIAQTLVANVFVEALQESVNYLMNEVHSSDEEEPSGIYEDAVESLPVPPQFQIQRETFTAVEGQNVTIHTKVYGSPLPTLLWYRDNKKIVESKDYKIITTEGHSQLIIKNVQLIQSGRYECGAENQHGCALYTCQLTVEEPKGKHEEPKAVELERLATDQSIHTTVGISKKPDKQDCFATILQECASRLQRALLAPFHQKIEVQNIQKSSTSMEMQQQRQEIRIRAPTPTRKIVETSETTRTVETLEYLQKELQETQVRAAFEPTTIQLVQKAPMEASTSGIYNTTNLLVVVECPEEVEHVSGVVDYHELENVLLKSIHAVGTVSIQEIVTDEQKNTVMVYRNLHEADEATNIEVRRQTPTFEHELKIVEPQSHRLELNVDACTSTERPPSITVENMEPEVTEASEGFAEETVGLIVRIDQPTRTFSQELTIVYSEKDYIAFLSDREYFLRTGEVMQTRDIQIVDRQARESGSSVINTVNTLYALEQASERANTDVHLQYNPIETVKVQNLRAVTEATIIGATSDMTESSQMIYRSQHEAESDVNVEIVRPPMEFDYELTIVEPQMFSLLANLLATEVTNEELVTVFAELLKKPEALEAVLKILTPGSVKEHVAYKWMLSHLEGKMSAKDTWTILKTTQETLTMDQQSTARANFNLSTSRPQHEAASVVIDEQQLLTTQQIEVRRPSIESSLSSSAQNQAPCFHKRLEHVKTTIGKSLQMKCIVGGIPVPTVRWFVDGDEITGNDDYELVYEDGVCLLRFKSVIAEDEGEYLCEATNTVGQAATSCFLKVSDHLLKQHQEASSTSIETDESMYSYSYVPSPTSGLSFFQIHKSGIKEIVDVTESFIVHKYFDSSSVTRSLKKQFDFQKVECHIMQDSGELWSSHNFGNPFQDAETMSLPVENRFYEPRVPLLPKKVLYKGQPVDMDLDNILESLNDLTQSFKTSRSTLAEERSVQDSTTDTNQYVRSHTEDRREFYDSCATTNYTVSEHGGIQSANNEFETISMAPQATVTVTEHSFDIFMPIHSTPTNCTVAPSISPIQKSVQSLKSMEEWQTIRKPMFTTVTGQDSSIQESTSSFEMEKFISNGFLKPSESPKGLTKKLSGPSLEIEDIMKHKPLDTIPEPVDRPHIHPEFMDESDYAPPVPPHGSQLRKDEIEKLLQTCADIKEDLERIDTSDSEAERIEKAIFDISEHIALQEPVSKAQAEASEELLRTKLAEMIINLDSDPEIEVDNFELLRTPIDVLKQKLASLENTLITEEEQRIEAELEELTQNPQIDDFDEKKKALGRLSAEIARMTPVIVGVRDQLSSLEGIVTDKADRSGKKSSGESNRAAIRDLFKRITDEIETIHRLCEENKSQDTSQIVIDVLSKVSQHMSAIMATIIEATVTPVRTPTIVSSVHSVPGKLQASTPVSVTPAANITPIPEDRPAEITTTSKTKPTEAVKIQKTICVKIKTPPSTPVQPKIEEINLDLELVKPRSMAVTKTIVMFLEETDSTVDLAASTIKLKKQLSISQNPSLTRVSSDFAFEKPSETNETTVTFNLCLVNMSLSQYIFDESISMQMVCEESDAGNESDNTLALCHCSVQTFTPEPPIFFENDEKSSFIYIPKNQLGLSRNSPVKSIVEQLKKEEITMLKAPETTVTEEFVLKRKHAKLKVNAQICPEQMQAVSAAFSWNDLTVVIQQEAEHLADQAVLAESQLAEAIGYFSTETNVENAQLVTSFDRSCDSLTQEVLVRSDPSLNIMKSAKLSVSIIARSVHDIAAAFLEEVPWNEAHITLQAPTPTFLGVEDASEASSVRSNPLFNVIVSESLGEPASHRSSQRSLAFSEKTVSSQSLAVPSYVIKRGSTASITCELNSYLPENTPITWFKGEHPIKIEQGKIDRISHDLLEVLVITKADLDDCDVYSLKVDNEVYPVAYLIVEDGAAEIQTSEKFLSPQQTLFVMEGRTSIISCQMDKPHLKLTWYRDRTVINESDRILMETYDDGWYRLVISDTQLSDQGTYYAFHNDSFTSITLVVEEQIDEREVTVSAVEDETDDEPNDYMVPPGSTATIACELEDDEYQQNLCWHKDGVELRFEDDSKMEHVKNGKKHYLIIHNTTDKDSGTYSVKINDTEFRVAQITICEGMPMISGNRRKRISNNSLHSNH